MGASKELIQFSFKIFDKPEILIAEADYVPAQRLIGVFFLQLLMKTVYDIAMRQLQEYTLYMK